MTAGGPKTEVTLPDPAPADGSPLRPALWHASALSCAGYQVAPHEFKHDASGQQWRTWHISPFPIRPQTDPVLATGSSQLMALMDTGLLVHRHPGSPYLAAYHGARNLDILRAYVAFGGPSPVPVALAGAHSPVVRLVPFSARAEAVSLTEMIRGQHEAIVLRDLAMAAALVTLGFPLAGANESGVVILGHKQGLHGVSVTCGGLTLSAAAGAYHGLLKQIETAKKQVIADGIQDPPLESPLEPSHAIHWAGAGALRRDHLRGVEAQLGHDSARLRSHILQGKSRRPGHAVIATKEEFEANEPAIINHLRRFG
jgi:hypothetical protein